MRANAMYKAIQTVNLIDIILGLAALAFGDRLGVAGAVLGLPVIDFIGIALIIIGVAGFAGMALVARGRPTGDGG